MTARNAGCEKVMERARAAREALVEDVEFILATDPADVAVVAARVGKAPRNLQQNLWRSQRHDLVRRMEQARQEVSPTGWNCGSPSCSDCGPAVRRRRAS